MDHAELASQRLVRRPRIAKAVCAESPVQQDCLEFAITVREKEGVWGGATAAERQRLVRRRRRERRAALASTG